MEMIGPVTIDGMPCYVHIACLSRRKRRIFVDCWTYSLNNPDPFIHAVQGAGNRVGICSGSDASREKHNAASDLDHEGGDGGIHPKKVF